MKVIAVVGPDGRVVGTTRQGPRSPEVELAMIPPPEHTVHEVEVPDDFEKLSAEEFHKKIATMLVESRRPPYLK